MARILLVDDEVDFRHSAAEALRDAGQDVSEAGSAEEAARLLLSSSFNVILTDLRMPGQSGIQVLREAAVRMPDCVLIVMTAFGTLETAIEALRLGATDYLLKPVDLELLVRKVNLLVRHQAALAENRFLRGALEIDVPSSGLVGGSPAIQEVRRLIARVAPTDSTVLIRGQSGTGKELVARAIHQSSPRADRPFVTINCGSIPETLLESELFGYLRGAFTGADRDKRGLFEVAADGTIFLDEIGELPLAMQPKILRALENREILRVGSTTTVRISARIIAATHRNLLKQVEQGAFRQDLFYRLNVFEIVIPPLCERPEDIRPLAAHLLTRLQGSLNRPAATLDNEALAALERYSWPGNVRELANVLERALILAEGPRIAASDLTGIAHAEVPGEMVDLKLARREFERAHILRIIAKFNGDKRRAAEAMSIDLSSLYRKLETGD